MGQAQIGVDGQRRSQGQTPRCGRLNSRDRPPSTKVYAGRPSCAEMPNVWSPLSNFLGTGRQDISCHLTVYFHPARQWGPVLEAVFIAMSAVAYAEIVCVYPWLRELRFCFRTRTGSVVPAHGRCS